MTSMRLNTLLTALHRHDQASARQLMYRRLPDGKVIDLVKGYRVSTPMFVIWDGEQARYATEHEFEGCLYRPPRLRENSPANRVRLPEVVGPKLPVLDIVDWLVSLLQNRIDVPESDALLIVAFVLSTWFIDDFPIAPYLCICGSFASGKSQLLRFLQAVCRRGLMIADPTPAAIYNVCTQLRPTIILDEFHSAANKSSDALMTILRTGSARGAWVPRHGGCSEAFGAKVICGRQPITDAALASRAIQVTMRPSRLTVYPLSDEDVEEIASNLQPVLLRYRLDTTVDCTTPGAATDFSHRTRDLADVLTAAIGDPQVKGWVLALVRKQHETARELRQEEPEVLVATAIFDLVHEDRSSVTVGEVAAELNRAALIRGERGRYEARAVGPILRSLGFKTERLGASGIGLRITQQVLRLAHEAAIVHGAPVSLRKKCERCEHPEDSGRDFLLQLCNYRFRMDLLDEYLLGIENGKADDPGYGESMQERLDESGLIRRLQAVLSTGRARQADYDERRARRERFGVNGRV